MIDKYKYSDKEMDEIIKSMVILWDSREQKNNHILDVFEKNNIAYQKKALERCDYSFYIPANNSLNIPRALFFDKEIAIERKASLDELANNWTKERDRFEKEMCLAPKTKILLIENSNYEDIVNGNYRSQYNKKAFLASLHTFWFRYNMPVFFMPNKNTSALFIKKYFEYYLKEFLR